MKGFSQFFIIVGVIALIAGIYAFIKLHNLGIEGSDIDAAVKHAGSVSALSAGTGLLGLYVNSYFFVWTSYHRVILTAGGGIAVIAGVILRVIAAIVGFIRRRMKTSGK